MRCKICEGAAVAAFTATVLGKYDVRYFRCDVCGFMQTEAPHWLAESYASAINQTDLGPVNRAITGSRLIEGMILSSFDKDASFVDYGAGYGVLVRLMRDRGFDFWWHDRYCENLFAKHFVARPGQRFELLTAFEVFEHLADPLDEIAAMLAMADNLLFTTLLVPDAIKGPGDWWYFSPEHGQHIAFYTVAALAAIARRFGLHLATDGGDTHLLSKRPIPAWRLRFFARDRRLARLARALLRRRMRRQSLLLDDFRAVSGHQL